MFVRIILLILAAVVVGVAGWFGRIVPFAEQWPMYEALRTTAAIIFAVIGAWMAIIYPERLKLSIRGGKQTEPSTTSGMSQLFTPVVNSTAILCIILVLGASAPILKRVELPIDLSACRGISYGLLAALTLWQLWTVILSLVPASFLKSYVDREDGAHRVREQLFSLVGKAASPTAPPLDKTP